ncbi:MAG TPA: hypothetical protein VGW78_06710 [Candidatus Babeliales bacterium]|jgi:hypothetical protein|nr:hypothetical protein [Candidatus Babeliales bacterium]
MIHNKIHILALTMLCGIAPLYAQVEQDKKQNPSVWEITKDELKHSAKIIAAFNAGILSGVIGHLTIHTLLSKSYVNSKNFYETLQTVIAIAAGSSACYFTLAIPRIIMRCLHKSYNAKWELAELATAVTLTGVGIQLLLY